MMIYFGFFSGLLEPTGTDLFSRANWIFFHLLRIGGVAMAALALWSLSGMRLTLIVDAVVSIAIGVLFALTGVVMLIDGGGTFQSVLNVMFGWMFVSAGRANWRAYHYCAEPAEHVARPMTNSACVEPPVAHPQHRFTNDRPEDTPTIPLAVATIEPAPPAPRKSTTPEPEVEPTAIKTVEDISDDTSGGFLESFADEGPPSTP